VAGSLEKEGGVGDEERRERRLRSFEKKRFI